MDYSNLCNELTDWYWDFGRLRTGPYALAPSDWLDRLYRTRETAQRIQVAQSKTKPAMAIWGPSQTGKSTSVSKDIDANSVFEGDPNVDGSNSGLHWEGGARAFFLAPVDRIDIAAGRDISDDTLILNPFRSGQDASACLSRFVCGTSDPGQKNDHHIKDPKYPVEVKFGSRIEVIHAIACGYGSQCLGPIPDGGPLDEEGRPRPRYHTLWSPDKLIEIADGIQRQFGAKDAEIDRQAYETTHELCQILDDLIFARVEKYQRLEDSWKALRHRFLDLRPDYQQAPKDQINALISNPEAAKKFFSTVLWDGYSVIDDYLDAISDVVHLMETKWAGKQVCASIEVAALFLDMESFSVAIGPVPGATKPRDNRIHQIVPKLRWEDRGDSIILGCDLNGGESLGQDLEKFGIVQSLVWELVIPLNPANLSDGPFRAMIETTDLLDFPGIERGARDGGNKIDLDAMADFKRRGLIRLPAGEDERQTENAPVKFFNRLLKRGKTSSIVQAYAKRMTIDGFSIFQDIDNDKCDPSELLTGIRTWWRSCAPEYYANQKGKSPLPLNFSAMWWGKFFNEDRDWSIIEGSILRDLDIIRNPDVSTSFALNYYGFEARGGIKDSVKELMPKRLEKLYADENFKRRYLADPVSKGSFEAMLEDKKTGGVQYFFTTIRNQMSGESKLSKQIRAVEQTIAAGVEALLDASNLLPSDEPEDDRAKWLQQFQERFLAAAADADEAWMLKANHAVRMTFNVPEHVVTPVPRDESSIDADLVHHQYYEWSRWQVDQFETWKRNPREKDREWNCLGFEDREEVVNYFHSLIASIQPDFKNVAMWLLNLVSHNNNQLEPSRNQRAHLAVMMSNTLLKPIWSEDNGFFDSFDQRDSGNRLEDDEEASRLDANRGRRNRFFRHFLEPVIAEGGRLSELISRQVKPVTRPDQPGDAEIVTVLKNNNFKPASQS